MISRSLKNVFGYMMVTCSLLAPFSRAMAVDYYGSADPYKGTPIPDEYVKVRVWASNFGDSEAGHVSLETPTRYLSLWPNRRDESRCKFVHDYLVGATTGVPNFVVDAPALNHMGYQQDLEAERKVPDRVYLMKANTNPVDRYVDKLLLDGSRNGAVTELTATYRWYAGGHSGVSLERLDSMKTYLNCASSVIEALSCDQSFNNVCQRYLQTKYGLGQLLSAFGELASIHAGPELGNSLQRLSLLAQVIIPQNVTEILDQKLRNDFEQKITTLGFDHERIDANSDIAVNVIMGRLERHTISRDQMRYGPDALATILMDIGIGQIQANGRLKLFDQIMGEVNQEIDRINTNRVGLVVGLGAIGTAALIGGKKMA